MTDQLKKSRKKLKNQSKVIDLNKPYTCEWCIKSFTKESTLFTHACEPKRRWDNQNQPPVKIGYAAYNLFYQWNSPDIVTNPKPYKEFSNSNLYTSFIRFGNWCVEQQVQEVEKYIRYLLKEKKKTTHWCDLNIYTEFLTEILRTETPESGLARTLKHIQKWSEEQNTDWKEFFKKVNTNVAVDWILQGRISPWMLYNCETAVDFFERCSEEQLILIQKIAPLKQWKVRLMRNKQDADLIKSVLSEAGM
jgi:hypothetical protein